MLGLNLNVVSVIYWLSKKFDMDAKGFYKMLIKELFNFNI